MLREKINITKWTNFNVKVGMDRISVRGTVAAILQMERCRTAAKKSQNRVKSMVFNKKVLTFNSERR